MLQIINKEENNYHSVKEIFNDDILIEDVEYLIY